jgi:hypothetical protein
MLAFLGLGLQTFITPPGGKISFRGKEEKMAKCQNVFKSFLVETDTTPYTILHSFLGTEECDEFHDLKKVREEIIGEVKMFGGKEDKDRMKRFEACETNKKDNKIIATIVSEQKLWMSAKIYDGLDCNGKAWYHTIYRFDRFAAAVSTLLALPRILCKCSQPPQGASPSSSGLS